MRNFGIVAGMLPLKALIMSLGSIKAPEFLFHLFNVKNCTRLSLQHAKIKIHAILSMKTCYFGINGLTLRSRGQSDVSIDAKPFTGLIAYS